MGPVREECGGREAAEDDDDDDNDVEEQAGEEEEEPDPRIQTELEKLNRATDAINSMETELEVCFWAADPKGTTSYTKCPNYKVRSTQNRWKNFSAFLNCLFRTELSQFLPKIAQRIDYAAPDDEQENERSH